MSDITIVSCNFNTKLFSEVMVKSIKKFSSEPHKLIILDNSMKRELYTNDDYEVVTNLRSHSHGYGLDFLVGLVETKYTLVLDIDTHILRKGFDIELTKMMERDERVGLVAGGRSAAKSVHPGILFFRTEMIKEHEIFFHAVKFMHPELQGHAFDVGNFAPLKLSYQKLKTVLLKRTAPVYDDTRGDTWNIGDKSTFYHFGYSRLNTPEIIKLRDNMFNQIEWV